MTKSTTYFPIIKWKESEQSALRDMELKKRTSIIPIAELVMPKPKLDIKKHNVDELIENSRAQFNGNRINEIPEEIERIWGLSPIILDFSLIYPEAIKHSGATEILSETKSRKLQVIPLINLSDSSEFAQSVLKTSGAEHGVCIRVTPSQVIDAEALQKRLSEFFRSNRISAEKASLLLDMKATPDYATYGSIIETMKKVTNADEYRHVVIASGSFPQDMGEFKIDEDNLCPRNDWIMWRDLAQNQELPFIPSYADYTIRYPVYDESFQFYHPTTSIKYTLGDSWWIMKGEKKKFAHYLSNANLLKEHERFYGLDFSAGDRYISEKGAHFEKYVRNPKLKGTGNTKTWLQAGINHHMSVVTEQLNPTGELV